MMFTADGDIAFDGFGADAQRTIDVKEMMDDEVVNTIKSVYPLDDFKERITNYSEQGKLIILNKKRVKDIFDATGIETSELSKNLNSENNIPDTLENVNPSQQNNSDIGKEFNDPNKRFSKDDTILDNFADEVMFTADGDIAFDGFGADAQRTIDVKEMVQEQGAEHAVYTLYNAAAHSPSNPTFSLKCFIYIQKGTP